MNISFKSRADVAQFVNDQLHLLSPGYVSTMIIKQETSEVFSVFTATALSSGVTHESADQTFYSPPTNTSPQNTPVG